jgi:hypothetical protein
VFHKPGDTIADNSSPNQVKLPFSTDLTNIGSSYTPAIPEDLNTFTLNRQTSGTDNSLFNYYKNTDNSQIGVLVGTNDNSDIIFQIAKDIDYVRIGTLCYKWSGSVNIGGGELTLYGKDSINIQLNNFKSCTLSTDENNFSIKNTNNNKEITIPYGTDLNKTTFRQSIIDKVVVANPYGNLYDKITDSQKYPTTIKTLVNDNIYPKTTNTILTVYYSSYIDTVQGTNIDLLDYYTNTGTAYAGITISISKASTPQLILSIKYTSGSGYKQYVVTLDMPKVTVDLTADLAVARPGEEIVSFKSKKSDTPWITKDVYYQDCVNILGNLFISYTYKD